MLSFYSRRQKHTLLLLCSTYICRYALTLQMDTSVCMTKSHPNFPSRSAAKRTNRHDGCLSACLRQCLTLNTPSGTHPRPLLGILAQLSSTGNRDSGSPAIQDPHPSAGPGSVWRLHRSSPPSTSTSTSTCQALQAYQGCQGCQTQQQ